jgi:hypothetical protein
MRQFSTSPVEDRLAGARFYPMAAGNLSETKRMVVPT